MGGFYFIIHDIIEANGGRKMVKVRLYLVRHGKTMFNTIGRAQGWSDTPLTAEGERGIQELGIGLRESDLQFERAYSSDSGRTIQTMELSLKNLACRGKSLIAWTSVSENGVSVVLMEPMMAIFSWALFLVSLMWTTFTNCLMLNWLRAW